MLLQPDDSENEEGSADDESGRQRVGVRAEDPQEAAEAAGLGDLLTGVAEAEPNAAGGQKKNVHHVLGLR